MEVRRHGVWQPVNALKQRTLLAILLIGAGGPISMDRLIDELWSKQPADPANQVHRLVSRLRRLLGDDHATVIETVSPGYRLTLAPQDFDAGRFDQLAEHGAAALHNGDLEKAATLLSEALTLWRGPAFADTRLAPTVATEGAKLEERRLAVLESHLDIELRLGRHASHVAELQRLVDEHPFREQFCAHLMLALYRTGRQAEALQTYQATYRRLDDELGIQPGRDLQQLHQRILRRDPDLAVAETDEAVQGAPAHQPAQLPADISGFTGRAYDLKRLDSLLSPEDASRAVLISAVEGIPGVGKTALAVHWAHRVSDRFPDGQLYLNMRGYAQQPPLPPIEALARLLRALGVPAERVPADVDESAAAYRSLLAGKRMLVLLDNAASADQVRPLLPGGGGSVVLVTSRDQLGGLVAGDGARRLNLDVLPAPDAEALVTRIVGAERAGAETQAVAELAELCGRLPLALRIAAANLAARPRQRIADYVARLRSADRLTALAVTGDPHNAVLVSFDLSYARLPAAARRMFRRLALVPGPDVTADAAAALAGLSADSAGRLLEQLAHAHLIEEHAAGRFTYHDLLRRYSADLADREEPAAGRAAAQERLYDYYLASADAAARTLYPQMLRLPMDIHDRRPVHFPDHQSALAWLDEELSCLSAAVEYAARHDAFRAAWLLADTLRGYFWMRRHPVDWPAVADAALAAAQADNNSAAQASAWLSLADANHARGEHQQAMDLYQRTRQVSQQVAGSEFQFAALTNLGVLYLQTGRLDQAAGCFEQVLAFDRQFGLAVPEAIQLGNLGAVYRAKGQLRRAADLHTEARAIACEAGILKMEASELRQLGETYHQLGRLDQARDLLTEAMSKHRLVGDRTDEAQAHLCLAAIQRDLGRPAIDPARTALALVRDIGDSCSLEADALNVLGSIHRRLGQQHRAINHHEQALQIAIGSELGHPQAEALIGLAAAHLRLDDYERAHRLLEQAGSVIEDAGFRLLEAHALTLLTELYLAEGDPVQATKTGEQALAVHHETGHRLGEAHTHVLLGRARQRTGDLDAAHDHRRQAHALYTQIGITPDPPRR